MRQTRREVATAALGALVASSGCLGFVTGQESLSFEADPAVAQESVANDTGYELDGTEAQTITREFSAAGQTRNVEVTNQISTCEKTLSLSLLGEQKLGVFAAISSPAVEIAGRTLNPIREFSNERLVQLLTSQYEGLSNVNEVNSQTLRMLDKETRVTKYEATSTVENEEIPVFIHVTKVRHEDDFVVALGVYPQQLSGEESNIVSLIESVQHPA
ncbi:hypothetical protein AUR64_04790 [Haloprofundus marisrubri]|uniref:Uncharacterized protein n=1 Tax=Haloprofundus marisrubri TaxID=1514971 RepID=A0A0W1RCW1_9EURY|nr:DUF6517 family protein [Haloprofundus marisrubri]KTG11247.1 hypothetical protein AUR64_04790 [Haloprofundus marisrubri]